MSNDVRDFLVSRRARITPRQAGLPESGRRRVPGLRREEVAVLAGVSIEWYTRLEKGHIKGVSDDVLEAVARALRLDAEERAYLLDLARAARSAGATAVARPPGLPREIQWMIDSMTLSAAVVLSARQDFLAVNPLARALFSPVLDAGHTNLARYHFTDPASRDFSGNWDATADILAASLRAAAARGPQDTEFQDLIGDLSAASPDFRTRWEAHNILLHCRGTKIYRHPDVGELTVETQSMKLPIPGQEAELMCATAEPGSPAEEKLKLLASWRHPSVRSAR
jgi:transcriptional regulator with XRE-family HTH domain